MNQLNIYGWKFKRERKLYRLSSGKNRKLEWIEKLDFVLSIVKSTWNGTLVITGDSNIDLLASTEI